ncbi:glycosyltransferase [bacterium]|nr:glycosyltransferase [bacterium]
MSTFTPVVLFVYNRTDHLRRTLDALNENRSISNTTLYVFSDGPRSDDDAKGVQDVRRLIREKNRFGNTEIIESETNKGLAASVIDGATQVLDNHGSIIVLEDDVVTSPSWYDFMNAGIQFYENNASIWSIGGYCPPIRFPASYPHDVFLSPLQTSMSWGTWSDRWKMVDWEIQDYDAFLADKERIQLFCGWNPARMRRLKRAMKNNRSSWAIRWGYAAAKQHSLNILPVRSRVNHIGFDEGEHYGSSNARKVGDKYSVTPVDEPFEFLDDLHLDPEIVLALRDFHHTSLWARAENFANRILGRFGFSR